MSSAQPIVDGDRKFVGVDNRRDPGQLEPGLVAEAENVEFSRGEVRTRKGFFAPPWGAVGTFDFPFDFDLDFLGESGHGAIYGAVPFTNQYGNRFFMLALERYSVLVHESKTVTVIRYPYTESLDDDVRMVQAYNKLYMFRGVERTGWVWARDENSDWVEVPQDGLAAGVLAQPKSTVATYYQNRLYVLEGRNEIYYSDIGDGDSYSLSNQFLIDSGGFDAVTRIYPFGTRTLIVFKEFSIALLDNLSGDLSANATQTTLSNEIGCPCPDTVIDVGADVWFLSLGGVYSVRQGFENKLRADAAPLSAPVQNYIDRINWVQKSKFQAAYFDNNYYLSVALDDSEVNNALLVYNFITQTWHGIHTADFLDVKRLFVTTYNDERQLFSVSSQGEIFWMYAGYDDDPLSAAQGVATLLKTRGYGGDVLERKRFLKMETDVSEWDSDYDIGVQADGVNEDASVLESVRRDRRKYWTFDTADYVLDNSNDDHGNPFREDYSIKLDPETFDFPFDFPLDFRGAASEQGTYDFDLGDNGANPDRLQRVEIKTTLRTDGDYLQVTFTGRTGRLYLHAVRVRSLVNNRTSTTRP